jgi:hypothetical protein
LAIGAVAVVAAGAGIGITLALQAAGSLSSPEPLGLPVACNRPIDSDPPGRCWQRGEEVSVPRTHCTLKDGGQGTWTPMGDFNKYAYVCLDR